MRRAHDANEEAAEVMIEKIGKRGKLKTVACRGRLQTIVHVETWWCSHFVFVFFESRTGTEGEGRECKRDLREERSRVRRLAPKTPTARRENIEKSRGVYT